jgi:hypothetical protein
VQEDRSGVEVSVPRVIALISVLAISFVASIAAKLPEKRRLGASEFVIRQFENQCISGQNYGGLLRQAEQSGWKADASDKRLINYARMMSVQNVEVAHAIYKKDSLFLLISESTHLNILKGRTKKRPLVMIGCEIFNMSADQQLEQIVLKSHFGEPASSRQDEGIVIHDWKRKSGLSELAITSQFISPKITDLEPRLNLIPGIGLRAGYVEVNKAN